MRAQFSKSSLSLAGCAVGVCCELLRKWNWKCRARSVGAGFVTMLYLARLCFSVWKEALFKGRGGRSGNLRSRLGKIMPSWRGALCKVVGWGMCTFVEATFLKPFHIMNFGRRPASHVQRICLTRARWVVDYRILI